MGEDDGMKLRGASSRTSPGGQEGDDLVVGVSEPLPPHPPPRRRPEGWSRTEAVAERTEATATAEPIGAHSEGVHSIRKVLVAIGGAISARSGLPMVEMLARMFQAELILVEILPREASMPAARISPREAQVTAYLEMVSAVMHAQGVHVHGLVLTASSAADAIINEAIEIRSDLIALGVSTKGGFPLALQPTVPHDVARRAPCPVLLIQQSQAPGRPPKVRSFDRDAAAWGPLARVSLGTRAVAIAQIVGSVGRAGDDVAGAKLGGGPATLAKRQRYQSVLQAMRVGITLPAVEIYKLGSGYYILDGNHRVAAARELGQDEIDADVTEFIPLGDAAAQRTVAERRAFERHTGLKEIVSAHVPGTFVALGELVDAFEIESAGRDIMDVARCWYSQEYLPLARAVHERGLLRHYPGEHTADVIARLATFRRHAARRQGKRPHWSEVIDVFATKKALRDKKEAIGHAHSVRQARGQADRPPRGTPPAIDLR